MLRSETQCWSKCLLRLVQALYDHLEVNHISFEHNSQVKVRNTLLVEKLTEGYISHIPPFGNEAH